MGCVMAVARRELDSLAAPVAPGPWPVGFHAFLPGLGVPVIPEFLEFLLRVTDPLTPGKAEIRLKGGS